MLLPALLDLTDGQPIGYQSAAVWLFSVPWGFQKQIKWLSQRYNNPGIWVMENGISGAGEDPLPQGLNDTYRIDYYSAHIDNMAQAMASGVKILGYTAWSICDNYEWADGYSKRFGLCYVDFDDNLKR